MNMTFLYVAVFFLFCCHECSCCIYSTFTFSVVKFPEFTPHPQDWSEKTTLIDRVCCREKNWFNVYIETYNLTWIKISSVFPLLTTLLTATQWFMPCYIGLCDCIVCCFFVVCGLQVNGKWKCNKTHVTSLCLPRSGCKWLFTVANIANCLNNIRTTGRWELF